MNAISEEGGEAPLRRLLRPQVEPHLPSLVAHDKFTAGRNRDRGQDDHQRGEHAGGLLGVAMTDEEVAFGIDQQLVKLRLDRPVHSQPLGRARNDLFQRSRPVLAQGNRVKPIKSFLRTAITLWVMSARRSVLLSESRLKNRST